jgi:hypothetical protein
MATNTNCEYTICRQNLKPDVPIVNRQITKYEINRIRLLLIKQELFDQYDSYNEFRQEVFPLVTLNAFRQWFKKPFFISDWRLCAMEEALSIPPSLIKARLKQEFNLSGSALQAAKGIQFKPASPQPLNH